MAPLVVNFNQLVDLAVNPLLGTINTSLLHNLLHVIINQMQLSTSFIEFHGIGSASIENIIVKNQTECELQVREFELIEKIDGATGNVIEGRKEVERPKSDGIVKLFTVHNNEGSSQNPTGYPLNPIQVLSLEQFKRDQRNSIHDAVAKVLPPDDKFTMPENSGSALRAMFDFINISKRLDALEIGIRQLADIMKQFKCDAERINQFQNDLKPEIEALNQKVESFYDEIQNLRSTVDENDDEENAKMIKEMEGRFSQNLKEAMTEVKLEIEKLIKLNESDGDRKLQQDERLQAFDESLETFQDAVCARLESYQNDLVNAMTEIQEMLDAKLDKCFVPDLKNFIQKTLHELEEKIEGLDCEKALAAGAAKKIFKDLICVSCGENVIQGDISKPTQSKLTKVIVTDPRSINMLRLVTPKRLCGGSHTIMKPIERVFRTEKRLL